MSAELMAAALVIDNHRQLDFKAGHEAIERLGPSDIDLLDEFADQDRWRQLRRPPDRPLRADRSPPARQGRAARSRLRERALSGRHPSASLRNPASAATLAVRFGPAALQVGRGTKHRSEQRREVPVTPTDSIWARRARAPRRAISRCSIAGPDRTSTI
jgi:hypothetical protein